MEREVSYEESVGLLTILYSKDSISFRGKYQVDLLISHSKRFGHSKYKILQVPNPGMQSFCLDPYLSPPLELRTNVHMKLMHLLLCGEQSSSRSLT